MGPDWGPVVVAVVLFILLSPGLLFQLPARTRVIEFGNMYTSGIAILVHAIIYFCIITILVVAIGIHIRADWSNRTSQPSLRLGSPLFWLFPPWYPVVGFFAFLLFLFCWICLVTPCCMVVGENNAKPLNWALGFVSWRHQIVKVIPNKNTKFDPIYLWNNWKTSREVMLPRPSFTFNIWCFCAVGFMGFLHKGFWYCSGPCGKHVGLFNWMTKFTDHIYAISWTLRIANSWY